jgi:hypothetical protein
VQSVAAEITNVGASDCRASTNYRDIRNRRLWLAGLINDKELHGEQENACFICVRTSNRWCQHFIRGRAVFAVQNHESRIRNVLISLSPTPTGRPACSYNTGWHFVLDTSTAAGKVTYSILLTAYASGQNVHVGGTNTCTVSPSGIVENLFYVSFAQ